jgi:hypothetical protein
MNPLDKIAPYPKCVGDASAEAMARYFAAFAQLHWRLAMDHRDADQARHSTNMAITHHGLAYLLREMPARDGDRLAEELWETWDSDGGVGVDLWNWLSEYGIDPDAIARQVTDVNLQASTKAGTGGAA